MKKICFLIIILLSSLVAKANDPDSTNSKLGFGIFYIPSNISDFDFFEDRFANYPCGFSIIVSKSISNKISMESGLNYKYKRIEDVRKVGSSNIAGDFNSIEIDKTNILEIPLKFKFYSIIKSKMSFYFICGITNSFYSRETIRMHIDYLGSYASIRNREYYNLIVNLGIGGQYNINNNIGILFEPSIGYFAIGGMQEYGVLELKTGVVYHF